MMDGKSLSRHIEALDDTARKLGVRPLSEFFSMPPDELAGFLDDAGDIELPPLQHFSAHDGLATVRALLAHTPTHAADHLAGDFRECERILTVAAQHEVG
jgi:hypothetical protein